MSKSSGVLSSELRARAMIVAAQLRAVIESPETTRNLANMADDRLRRIDQAIEYLDNHAHSVAFVGGIGAGKSSMIGVISRLLAGEDPTDKQTLKGSSVLAVGAGGTTVCEVRIRATTPAEAGRIGLRIEPCTVEEMSALISGFARDEWDRRRNQNFKLDDQNDSDPTPREVQRVIRNMTGTTERHSLIPGTKKRHVDDPIDDIVASHDSAGSFANYMIERAGLLSRHETDWWWDDANDPLLHVKRRFDEINHGRTPTAMLPRKIELVVPAPLPDSDSGLNLTLIDTRGFDGQLSTRDDIQAVLRDGRCLVVSCSSFKDAPGEGLRSLLQAVNRDARLRSSVPRTLLVLMDHDDAAQVNGADGDPGIGQEIKRRECARSLETLGLGEFADEERLTAFDAIKDDRATLIQQIDRRLLAMRVSVRDRLDQEVADAVTFLDKLEDQRVELARDEVDQRLALTYQACSPEGTPLRDPLEGLYEAITRCRYASQVQAANRRNGRYYNMDAYAAVRSGAAVAATGWLKDLEKALGDCLATLAVDPEMDEVGDHLRLRRSQLESGVVQAVNDYADNVMAEIEARLGPDDALWVRCANEWGCGPGFKDRVRAHLSRWCRHQASLYAHEQPEPELLLSGIEPPEVPAVPVVRAKMLQSA